MATRLREVVSLTQPRSQLIVDVVRTASAVFAKWEATATGGTFGWRLARSRGPDYFCPETFLSALERSRHSSSRSHGVFALRFRDLRATLTFGRSYLALFVADSVHQHTGLVSNSISEPGKDRRRPLARSTILPAARALILCVERDPHLRELEAYFLDEAGFAVHFAGDGESALELARSLKPAIIITEILVPKRDGLALCRELKECAETKDTPILVFSLLAAEARAREAGAAAFLKKPLAEHRLVDAVCELLRSREPQKRDDRDERSRR